MKYYKRLFTGLQLSGGETATAPSLQPFITAFQFWCYHWLKKKYWWHIHYAKITKIRLNDRDDSEREVEQRGQIEEEKDGNYGINWW